MTIQAFLRDARWFQITFQLILLSYGLLALHWDPAPLHYITTVLGCLFFTWLFTSIRQRKVSDFHNPELRSGLHSSLISAASLCLLLHVNHWVYSLLAALLTVSSKHLIRSRGKHIFNPSAFGIVATILLTNQAWISSGQWGEGAVLFFGALVLGVLVVTRVQKLDVSLAFVLAFAGLLFVRQRIILGWPMDYFSHTLLNGNLLIFAFFMISDPRTAPNHRVARVAWAAAIGAVAFYYSAYRYANATPIFALVALAPAVPMLDRLFRAKVFNWHPGLSLPSNQRVAAIPFGVQRLGATLVLLFFASISASAFCGFYVSKADGTLKNKTSEVIMVRDGQKNTVTMYNDFSGDTRDFAMVIPVPVILKKSDIRVIDPGLFKRLNDYSAPRLVEYYDDNPCEPRVMYDMAAAPMSMQRSAGVAETKSVQKVKVEAQYLVGEYDILILSATESDALKTWLLTNGYKIPPNAEEVLDPYIKSKLKFFVVKVNEAEKAKLANNFLRPIQITFSSPRFMLPIRLGMANADGDQDLIVYCFTRNGRVELSNYRTSTLPTGKQVPLFVEEKFGQFYSRLFEHQWQREGKSVGLVEYAWDISPRNFMKCDPCIAEAPNMQDLANAGVDWATGSTASNASVFFTRMHIRYNRKTFPQDLQFQNTPNTENYQARYIITHPATGSLNCPEARPYRERLRERRRNELANLQYLTGVRLGAWGVTGMRDPEDLPEDLRYTSINAANTSGQNPGLPLAAGFAGLTVLGCIGMLASRKRG